MLRQWDERFIEWPRNCFSFREGFNLSTCQFFRRQKYTQSYIHVYLRGFKINRKVAWQRIQKSMRSIEERVIPLSSCSIFMVFYGHHWDIEKQESSVIIIRIFSYINHRWNLLTVNMQNMRVQRRSSLKLVDTGFLILSLITVDSFQILWQM